MTYIVSSGALNSTHSLFIATLNKVLYELQHTLYRLLQIKQKAEIESKKVWNAVTQIKLKKLNNSGNSTDKLCHPRSTFNFYCLFSITWGSRDCLHCYAIHGLRLWRPDSVNAFDQSTVASWRFHNRVSTHSVVGLSLLQSRQNGAQFQTLWDHSIDSFRSG